MLEIYFTFPSVVHFLLRILYRAFLEVECKKTWRPVHLVPSLGLPAGGGGGTGGGRESESERRGEHAERRGRACRAPRESLQSAAGELAERRVRACRAPRESMQSAAGELAERRGRACSQAN